jgi:organic radical activating enzyme
MKNELQHNRDEMVYKDKCITRVPYSWKEFELYVNENNPNIIVFGADIVGKVMTEFLKEKSINVKYYVDNNKNKCGTDLNGIKVEHSEVLIRENKDTVVLIASTYIRDIIIQLEDIGFYNWLPIYRIIEDNKNIDLTKFLNGNLRKNHTGGTFTKDFDDFAISNMVNSQKKYLDQNHLYIRSIDFVITEKCSLKCKDCANLMQYYENPSNINTNLLFSELDGLCKLADEINELRIIGGDPFMNKDCCKIVSRATKYKQINKVVVYTNGTICPRIDQLSEMVNEKTFIFITTYGELSKNAIRLTKLLDQVGIEYNIQAAYGWTKCGDIRVHNRDEKLNKKIFKSCCAKNFTTMTDGKIFRCPFAANTERLKAIPYSPNNFVSLNDLLKAKLTLRQKKQTLTHYLREIEYIPACDSCNGRTYGDTEIKPGMQASKPIEYQEFARNK